MSIFDSSDERIKGLYHRANHEAGGKEVNPHEYKYLDQALRQYAKDNECSYTEALAKAKNN